MNIVLLRVDIMALFVVDGFFPWPPSSKSEIIFFPTPEVMSTILLLGGGFFLWILFDSARRSMCHKPPE